MGLHVAGIWKKFRIPHEHRSPINQILSLVDKHEFSYEEFWALKDVDFSVERGEALGIMGRNGSGKSTLLKVVAGILRPDQGIVRVNGRMASMLDLGAAFHPDLSVKENITIYGSVLGLTNMELKKRLPAILQFAELEKFQDAKLKSLSVGMQLRLGFSIAIQSDPDIFLVDEVLAVGDLHFQRKCLEWFSEFKSSGGATVLVSHSTCLVKEFCTKALLLCHGEVAQYGQPQSVIQQYSAE